MAIGKRPWRPVPIDCWDWLEDLSPLAQRLWFWLWTGPTSTPHGIVTVRAYHAAGALGTKKATLLDALAELQKAGLATVQTASDTRINLYLVGFVIAQCSVNEAQRQAIRRAIVAVDLGLLTTQALEDWSIWDAACAEADRRRKSGKRQPDHQQEQEQEQEQDNSLPIGRHVPAVADTDRPTGQQCGQHLAPTQPEAVGQPFLLAPDHAPAQAQKRQPQGQDGGKTAKRPRTVAEQKPTAEQTRAYFASQNAPESEADACLDYWQAQGFRRKAGPILDWEATCRTWIRNWRDRGSQTTTTHSYGKPAPRVAPLDQRTPEEVAANQARITAEIERYEREGRSYF